MSEQRCVKCERPAAIVDNETTDAWCLNCGTALVQAGDPVLDYTELAEGPMYTSVLRKLSTQRLNFG